MDTFGRICLWLLLGIAISGIAYALGVPMSFNDMKFLLPICVTLLSFNFAACSACCNALLKYKEMNPNKDISSIVKEMKTSILAMAIGLPVELISLFCLNFLDKDQGCSYLKIACNGLTFAVLIMYIFLIYDIASSFFDLVGNKK